MVIILEVLFECMKVNENICIGQAYMGEGNRISSESEAGGKNEMRRYKLRLFLGQ